MVDTSDLSPSAKRALIDVAALLAEGFTGRVELECMDGGVRCLREIKERRGAAIGRNVPVSR